MQVLSRKRENTPRVCAAGALRQISRVMHNGAAKTSVFSRFGRWAAELVLVFIGVYGAFWLNNYQQNQQEVRRRDQILESLERLLSDGVANARTQGAKEDVEVAKFQRALEAGENPPLHAFVFTTDYSATDIATLLQSGGIELLEVKTLTTLRELESVIRWGLSRMTHYEKLSDQLIAPNLDQDVSFFYDPTSKRLRKRFEIYPEALQAEANFFRDLEKAQTELLKQIQVERRRR